MSDRRNVWTEEMDGELTQMWTEGHTGAVIASHFRTTRNAVIGRVHRLHLPPRPSPLHNAKPRTRRTPEQVVARAAPKPVAPVVAAPPPPPPVPSVRLCQYPHGDPGEPGFRFCEAPVRGAGPYCPTHIRLCWAGRARAAHALGHWTRG